MKKLVVYYSSEGSTKFVAEAIAGAVGADILNLKPERDLSSHGFAKYFWGGKQVIFREKPKLMPFDKNPGEYDVLFVGTPVWAGTFTPPLRSFFSQAKLRDKKIALFCCCGGSGVKTIGNMRKELVGNEFVGEIEFVMPLQDRQKSREKAVEWAGRMLSQ